MYIFDWLGDNPLWVAAITFFVPLILLVLWWAFKGLGIDNLLRQARQGTTVGLLTQAMDNRWWILPALGIIVTTILVIQLIPGTARFIEMFMPVWLFVPLLAFMVLVIVSPFHWLGRTAIVAGIATIILMAMLPKATECDQDCQNKRNQKTSVASVATPCDGSQTEVLPLSPQGRPLTDGRKCQILLDVVSGVVRAEGSGGSIDISPVGIIRQDPLPPDWRAVVIRSMEPNTTYRVRLCPDGMTRWDNGCKT